MITGQEKPDAGSITIGESVKLSYVDQSRDTLDDKKTVWEEISGGNDVIYVGKKEIPSRAYCSAFNFKGGDQQKKVGMLSGGERKPRPPRQGAADRRQRAAARRAHNDLDVDTLRALEEALEDYAGCAVIISHDRFFLDRIATHMLAFEGDSHVEWFEGNFADYEEDRSAASASISRSRSASSTRSSRADRLRSARRHPGARAVFCLPPRPAGRRAHSRHIAPRWSALGGGQHGACGMARRWPLKGVFWSFLATLAAAGLRW